MITPLVTWLGLEITNIPSEAGIDYLIAGFTANALGRELCFC